MYSKKINETNSNVWKTKYLKYKQKYIDLKNLQSQLKQTGGMGSISSYWNQHPQFTTPDITINVNEIMKKTMCLQIGYNPHDSQFLKLSEILSQLLNIKDGTINLDFINNFYRNIYYDFKANLTGVVDTSIPGDFGIKVEGSVYSWIHPENNQYNIISTHVHVHSRTTILILQNKDPTKPQDKKVLKVFNTDLNPNKIKDYLSLQIIVNPDDNSSKAISEYRDRNYINLKKATLDAYNFNMQTQFMRTDDSNILLATYNIDPINDYLVNIIMQQIELDNQQPVAPEEDEKKGDAPVLVAPVNSFTFIKYHNLFVTSITEPSTVPFMGPNIYWRYCILMDYMDGTIDMLLKEKIGDNIARQTKILDILQQSENALKIFKDYKYLFTHTDFKVENLFYKNNADGNGFTIYLGDFDKSSISYHGIRFYPGGRLSTSNILFDWLAQDNYTKLVNPALNKLDFILNRRHIYKISRTVHNYQKFVEVEFEELYMRYNFMPYYMSFDICSLIMSLIHTHHIDTIDHGTPLMDFLRKYIDNDDGIIQLFTIFNTEKTEFKGDFGKLISLLINGQGGIARNTVRFINTFPTHNYIYINRLYLSEKNKLCLSLPFAPNFVQERQIGTQIETVASPLGTNKEKDYIDLYAQNRELLDNFYKDVIKSKVEYCNDWTNDVSFYQITRPTFIIKTNRYSQISIFQKYIWDYDNFPNEKHNKESILKYFKETKNENKGIEKNMVVPKEEQTQLLATVAKLRTTYSEFFDPIMEAVYQ
jgi:hypothetical protein